MNKFMFQKYYEIILIDIKQISNKDRDGNDLYDGEEVVRYSDTIIPLVGDVIHCDCESYIVQERHHSAECSKKVLLVEKIEENDQNLVVDDKLTIHD